MNCKYCGASLPTKGGVCPSCGRMIPMSQQKEMRKILDPKWNQYRNKDTAYYKSASNNETNKEISKIWVLLIGVILVIILIIIIKGLG